MTAWWTTTTRVRKVRARSSAALRVLAFGTARISAGAAELEMDVMRAPAGGRFRCCCREPDSARATRQNAKVIRLARRQHVTPGYRHRGFLSGLPGDAGACGVPRKRRPNS